MKLILNYHDAILYDSDISLLQNDHEWLNDACLHFYLTVLQHQHPNIKFMDPSVVTYLMHQCDADDMKDFAENFDRNYSMFFIPVNDCHGDNSVAWRKMGGGCHWSLLVIIPSQGIYHVDSIAGSNFRAAQAVAQVMITIIEPNSDNWAVSELFTPQQDNPFDCGLYVLAAAEVLANATLCSIESLEKVLNEESILSSNFGSKMRSKILETVREIKRNSNKNVSSPK
jgi:sentrin-specific protease 8